MVKIRDKYVCLCLEFQDIFPTPSFSIGVTGLMLVSSLKKVTEFCDFYSSNASEYNKLNVKQFKCYFAADKIKLSKTNVICLF